MRAPRQLLGALLVIFVVTGCSTTGPAIAENSPSDKRVAELRYRCLKDKGWDVRSENGAIFADVPSGQRESYRADAMECLKKAGIDPDAPLTDEQYKDIFASYVKIQACLEKAGWRTPARPSFSAFVSTYDTAPWIPWSEVPGPDTPRAGKECPAMMGGSDGR